MRGESFGAHTVNEVAAILGSGPRLVIPSITPDSSGEELTGARIDRNRPMPRQEFEFTLVLSGITELTPALLDAFCEAGCDDALFAVQDGVAYADFCRAAPTSEEAVQSAIRDVESAVVGVKVARVDPEGLAPLESP